MELPRRDKGDELLRPGEMTALRARLRAATRGQDLSAVVACAFDHRTRLLPFIYADLRMAPAGSRAIGSALVDAGIDRTRIVLQQWRPNFQPSAMRLEGRLPDLFLVSSMALHAERMAGLLLDAGRIDPAHRPLTIAGGAKAVYEPWDCFGLGPGGTGGADVAVTGEEFVLLSLLEVVLAHRRAGEGLRAAFLRAKHAGALDAVPGLVYPVGDEGRPPEALVDTGIQRLLGDLDELPHPRLGYALLDPPGSGPHLSARPLAASAVAKHTPLASLVLTYGCKFRCPYCPIPAYNQRQHRMKSPGRIVDEFHRLRAEYGLRLFFGTDDNFFNTKERTLSILEALARAPGFDGRTLGKSVYWGTEATVHDTLALRDHLATARRAGLRALWMGVEDMTATLVKKGQSVDKTSEAFRLLQANGINPMPMMMHHDSQPLWTPGKPYGLLNQAHLLRKAGALSFQCLMISPATGSKLYGESFESGLAFESVGGQPIQAHQRDGSFVIASRAPHPWQKQRNLLLAYLFFYNPLRFLWALVRPKSRRTWLADALMQGLGMFGLLQSVRRTAAWGYRLRHRRIGRSSRAPTSRLPMRAPAGGSACHALPGTPAPAAHAEEHLEPVGAR